MADTRAATGLTAEQWDNKFFEEYVQTSPFKSVMGTTENSIIQMHEVFNKGKGDALTIALVNRLTGSAVTGTNVLEGNEQDLASRSFRFNVDKRRTAVRIAEMEEYRSAIDLRDAAKSTLMTWSQEDVRDRIIAQLGSKNGVLYATATEAQKDAWLVDNADRVLFGAAVSNNSSNDHSASLANIDNTADKLTPEALSLMKRLATATRTGTHAGKPKITPIRIEGQNRRYFKVYAGPRTFRDLKTNATITQAQREVSLEMENNRLFQGGDLVWDGMIIHEVDDIAPITGVGAGGIDVEPVYLCGAQAMVYGLARRYATKTKTFDYGDKYGVAIECIDGIFKTRFGTGAGDTDDTVDHGVVTGYFAAVAD
jgi:N4-gp56 family major capsid protein